MPPSWTALWEWTKEMAISKTRLNQLFGPLGNMQWLKDKFDASSGHDHSGAADSGADIALRAVDGGELTISSGSITIGSDTHYHVDTEGDASTDDLDTISGTSSVGRIVILRCEDAAREVVVKHGTGNILTQTGKDVYLRSTRQLLMLMWDGSNWIVRGTEGSIVAYGAILGNGEDEVATSHKAPYPAVRPHRIVAVLLTAPKESGSITVDIKTGALGTVPATSICGSDYAALSSAQTLNKTSFTGWDLDQDDWIAVLFEPTGGATTITLVGVLVLGVPLGD